MTWYSPEPRASFPFHPQPPPGPSPPSLFLSRCKVTRQLFPSSLVRVLWAVAFEYNGPVDAPLWLHQYFLLSLSFLPRVFFRVLVCFSPGSAFFRRRFCRPSCPHVFSLVLCHDAVFGWSDGPSSSILLLSSTTIACMQSQTARTCEFKGEEEKFNGDATCTLSSFFTTFPTASRVSIQENGRARDLPAINQFRIQFVHNDQIANCCTPCAMRRGVGVEKMLAKKLQIIYYDVCITALHKAGGEVVTAVASFSST